MLERRDEGQLHALAQLVAGLGRGVAVLEAQSGVRERLDPDGLERRQAEVVVVVDGGGVVDRQHRLGRRSIRFRQVLVAIV